jgi:hypothetical protein
VTVSSKQKNRRRSRFLNVNKQNLIDICESSSLVIQDLKTIQMKKIFFSEDFNGSRLEGK